MNIYKPELVSGDQIAMAVTNPRHLVPSSSADAARLATSGADLAALGEAVGASDIAGASSFQTAMLDALDAMNAEQNESTELLEAMVTDPDSVDAHDVTIAMSKASLSLNISRTVLNRLVTGWKEIINTR